MTSGDSLLRKWLLVFTATIVLNAHSVIAAESTQDTGTYRAYTISNGSLLLIDPQAPRSGASVVANGPFPGDAMTSLPVSGGTVANGNITDVHGNTLAFVNGGRLYKVSLLKSGTRRATQMTSVSDACQVDGTYSDFARVTNSGVTVVTAGTDTQCGTADDVQKFTKISSNSTIAPTAMNGYQIEAPLYRTSDGVLLGYVIRKGRDVRRVNSNFTLPGTHLFAMSAIGDPLQADGVYVKQLVYLQAKLASDGKTHLFRLNSVSGALADVYTFTGAPGISLQVDAANVYITDGLSLRRIAHTGTQASTLGTFTGVNSIAVSAQTEQRLIVTTYKNSAIPMFQTNSLRSLLKAGGSLKTLQADGQSLIGPLTAGNRVYYSAFNMNTGAITGSVVLHDASARKNYTNGIWTPGQLDTNFGNAGSSGNLTNQGIKQMTLVQTLTTGGLRFSLNNPESPTLDSTSVATVSTASFGSLIGLGRYLMGNISAERSDGQYDSDLYFFDTQTPGSFISIRRVTGVDEVAVSY